jgi:inorganic pyrophosphatase
MMFNRMLKFAAVGFMNQPPPPSLLLKRNFNVHFDFPYGRPFPDGRISPVNYGEIPGTKNKVDGDAWDIIVPGLKSSLSGIKVDRIVGLITDRAGDHKLIGMPVGMMMSKELFDKQLSDYLRFRKRDDPSARIVQI